MYTFDMKSICNIYLPIAIISTINLSISCAFANENSINRVSKHDTQYVVCNKDENGEQAFLNRIPLDIQFLLNKGNLLYGTALIDNKKKNFISNEWIHVSVVGSDIGRSGWVKKDTLCLID